MAVYVSQVIQDYEAANPDEMSLHIGDKISISCVFADGWGQGKNETTDETGLFPVVCVSSI
ncbi:hypothetical protein BC833DRAFT_527411 [Globomyces pollinis-pini]|nr:hypothetical protein BC833DRAFT_527411 [Globomyces pollinis-pini]